MDYESGGIGYNSNKPLIPDGKLPVSRNGCSSVFADNKLVVFGGTYTETEGKFTYLNETWLFDCVTLHWHKINCAGNPPCPRYNHTAHIVGSRMFVFGGKGANGVLCNDMYFLDLVEWTWVPIAALSTPPCARLHHASALVGRKIVVHGGWDCEKVLDDMWIFNTDSFAWMQPKTTGFAPTGRFGHSMTLSPDGRLILFGGCNLTKTGVPCYNNDIRYLDTETMIWARPKVFGVPPTGRYAHSATLIDNNTKLCIFGGWGKGGCQTKDMINNCKAHSVHLLDIASFKWLLPEWRGKRGFKHLFGHACATAPGSNSLILFGGSDGRQSVNDLIIVNFDIPSQQANGYAGESAEPQIAYYDDGIANNEYDDQQPEDVM